MKKCEYGELSEAFFCGSHNIQRQTDRHCTFRNGRKGHVLHRQFNEGESYFMANPFWLD
jgi:hypothetical protein